MTVANSFGLTKKNAPSNPAFLNEENLRKTSAEKTIKYYGCYALEESSDGVFFLERLAVIPSERHKGLGGSLVPDAVDRVKAKGGKKISVGIIDKYKVLKNRYRRIGFIETGKKRLRTCRSMSVLWNIRYGTRRLRTSVRQGYLSVLTT